MADIPFPDPKFSINMTDQRRYSRSIGSERLAREACAALFVVVETKRRLVNAKPRFIKSVKAKKMDKEAETLREKAEAWRNEAERLKEEMEKISNARLLLHINQFQELKRHNDGSRSPVEHKLEDFLMEKKPKWVKKLF